MTIYRRFCLTLALLVSGLLPATLPAAACTCAEPPDGIRGYEAISKWQIDNAKNIVRGRIISVRAEAGTTKYGRPTVTAVMRVSKAVKGDIPAGEITILTGFGLGDCGIPGMFLESVALTRDLVLEVHRLSDKTNMASWAGTDAQGSAKATEYSANMCGFGHVLSVEEQEKK